MMNKYNPNIHNRRSIRLKGYDYAQAGLYFITICCKDMKSLFGEIVGGKMVLNKYGKIANDEWLKTPELRPNVELGEFVVMPNHIHGIIRLLGRGELHSPDKHTILHSPINETELHSPNNRTGELHSPNNRTGELHSPNDRTGELHSPPRVQPNTIGAIIRGYKSSVTKQLNLLDIGCVVWQRNYHEHIIRNEKSYQNISKYIINNPAKWAEDRFYLKFY